MPAEVNSTVGSSAGISEALGIRACERSRKKSRNRDLSSSPVRLRIFLTSCAGVSRTYQAWHKPPQSFNASQGGGGATPRCCPSDLDHHGDDHRPAPVVVADPLAKSTAD